MKDLPEFDLAPLTRFNPKVIRKEFVPLDGFFLALALAYNDLKTANWILEVVEPPADKNEVTGYNGQVSGMRVHATRILLGIVHELLKAVAVAAKQGLLGSKEFQVCLDGAGRKAKEDWTALVDSATASDQKDPFRKWLVRVRNSVVSHYYQPEDLHKGYVAFFFDRPAAPHNEWAFASLGESLERSRFYFADAAAGAAYDDVFDPTDEHVKTASEFVHRINNSLRFLVARYFAIRQEQETGRSAAEQ